jgi:molybdenum cofactor cytidylyltransferase
MIPASTDSIPHAVIILAAGESKRLGVDKQLVRINGEFLINRTIRIALATQPMQTLVVLGHHADSIHSSIIHPHIERIDCTDWQYGMSASLRAGIHHVHPLCAGALILLCDQPALSGAHLIAMVSAWRQQPDHAVASAYANTIGVPAVLPRTSFESLLAIQGDQGAKAWLRQSDKVIALAAPELVQDVDIPSDLPPELP